MVSPARMIGLARAESPTAPPRSRRPDDPTASTQDEGFELWLFAYGRLDRRQRRAPDLRIQRRGDERDGPGEQPPPSDGIVEHVRDERGNRRASHRRMLAAGTESSDSRRVQVPTASPGLAARRRLTSRGADRFDPGRGQLGRHASAQLGFHGDPVLRLDTAGHAECGAVRGEPSRGGVAGHVEQARRQGRILGPPRRRRRRGRRSPSRRRRRRSPRSRPPPSHRTGSDWRTTGSGRSRWSATCPRGSRMTVRRSPTSSTVPSTAPTRMMSPLKYCPSTRIRTPIR